MNAYIIIPENINQQELQLLEYCIDNNNNYTISKTLPEDTDNNILLVGNKVYNKYKDQLNLPDVIRGVWYGNIIITHDLNKIILMDIFFNQFYLDVCKVLNNTKYIIDIKQTIIPKNINELNQVLSNIPANSLIAFDIEADSLQWYQTKHQNMPYRILQIGIYYDNIFIAINHALIYEQFVPNEYIYSDNIFYADEINLLDDNLTGCLHTLKKFFNRTDLKFTAHNAKYDCLFLATLGININVTYDSMLLHNAINERTGTHGLKQLAIDYLGFSDYENETIKPYLKNSKSAYSNIPLGVLTQYCGIDCAITHYLTKLFIQITNDDNLFKQPFSNLIMPAHHALLQVEQNGITLDVDHLLKWQIILEDYICKLTNEIQIIVNDILFKLPVEVFEDLIDSVKISLANNQKTYSTTVLKWIMNEMPFNPNSVPMVSTVLYDLIHLPYLHINELKSIGLTRQRTTSSKAIQKLSDQFPQVNDIPFIKLLLKYRRVTKIYNTYIKGLLNKVSINNKIHASYNIIGTEIGRLSASNPNVQQIPRPYDDLFGSIIRSSFMSTKHNVLIDADISQAELRVAAVESGDPFLLDIYKNDRDLHTETAIELFGLDYTKEQRVWCKNLNFSDLYGGNAASFASQTNLPFEEAKRLVEKRQAVMQTLTQWKEQNFSQAKIDGFVVNAFGRKRRFPLITTFNHDEIRKASTHMIVASTASDLTLLAVIDLVLIHGIKVVLTVHDSIICECAESEAENTAALIKNVMLEKMYQYNNTIRWKVDTEIKRRWSPKPVIIDNLKLDSPSIIKYNDIKELDCYFDNDSIIQVWDKAKTLQV